MKAKSILALVAALLLSTLNSQFSTAFAQGALTPPGAPAPTMKSLDQIEARTPISSVPFTISQPGSYYLTTNVSVSSGDAITIATNNVTLDLNGFTISSTRPVAVADRAILLSGGPRNVAIYNGHISSGVTNSAAGVFGGGGFGYGIFYSINPPDNVRVKDVSVAGVLAYGIVLDTGNSTVVESCTVTVAGSYGIYADNVSDSTAMNCGNFGISASTAHNCRAYGVGNGVGLAATTVNNCYGQGSGNGYGLEATTANNCYGYSSGSGVGLSASTANDCYGLSAGNNYGLYADNANNCYGESDGNGTGLNATSVATGCSAYSASGTGLSAFIASICHGRTSTGAAFNVTHSINSF